MMIRLMKLMEYFEKKAEGLNMRLKISRMHGITLDTFCGDSIIPTFIKIDVEGEELRVIHGSRELIKKHKPRLLVEAHKSYDPKQVGNVVQYVLRT